MGETFKSAMRAVRDGWVNGEPFCRRISLGATVAQTLYLALLFVSIPIFAARVTLTVAATIGLAIQLWLVAQMPRRSTRGTR